MPEQRKNGLTPTLRAAHGNLENRREIRYELPIEIEVSGIDQNGNVFHEPTFTRDVSNWGCAFPLSVHLKPDDMISLRVASPESREFARDRSSLFQVLRVAKEGDAWLVAVWKVDSGDAWGVDLEKLAKHQGHQPKEAEK